MKRRKERPSAKILVPDGAGGQREVEDHRFSDERWPIAFAVPMPDAERWLAYLSAESRKRRFQQHEVAQLDPAENSGSITIVDLTTRRELALSWQRRKDRQLIVKARAVGEVAWPEEDQRALLDDVTAACAAKQREKFAMRGQLVYQGGPWRGELWLASVLRLGPPSMDADESILYVPRTVLVDAEVEAIDWLDASAEFRRLLTEVAGFLSVVMCRDVRPPETGRWDWTFLPKSSREWEIRQVGYMESKGIVALPTAGELEPTPLREVRRPDFSILGYAMDASSPHERPPSDVRDLWKAYEGLTPERRLHFNEITRLWRAAMRTRSDDSALGYALLTASGEALKPRENEFRRANFYDVVRDLLGEAAEGSVRKWQHDPVRVRGVVLHTARPVADDGFEPAASYRDPTFSMSTVDLTRLTQAMIIEWLGRGAVCNPRPGRQANRSLVGAARRLLRRFGALFPTR